ncbi:MAG: hypothetical protein IK080_04885 [Clostridia bacterium]|nr:hypothetical protein [Clostridia bacterium]
MKPTAFRILIAAVLILALSFLSASCGTGSQSDTTSEETQEIVREMPILDEETDEMTMETLIIDDLIETASSVRESKDAAKAATRTEPLERALPAELTETPETTATPETTTKAATTTAKATTAATTAKPTTAAKTTAKPTTAAKTTAKPTTAAKTTRKTTTAAPVRSVSDCAYVLNTNTMKFHKPNCKSVQRIAPKNYAETDLSRDEIIAMGYSPCGNCHP